MTAVQVQNDLRGRFGDARDQGSRPTCIAFALSDLHASSRTPWDPLSAEYLYFHANGREGKPAPNAGVTIASVRAAMHEDGQPLEAGWPYLGCLPADLSSWAPPTTVEALFKRETTLETTSFNAAWNRALAQQPLVLAMTVSKSFYVPGPLGVIDAAEPVEITRRHAVLAVGTGVSGTTRFLLIRNSWGGGWGLSGHAWLSESYLSPRLISLIALK